MGNVEDSLYLNLTVSENEISLLLTDMGLEDFSYQMKAREQNKIKKTFERFQATASFLGGKWFLIDQRKKLKNSID